MKKINIRKNITDFSQINLEFLLEILDYTMGNIFITNRDGKIIYVNQHTAESFGLTKQEIMHSTAQELVEKQVISRSTSLAAIQAGDTIIGNVKTITGEDLYNISTPVFDDDGSLLYMVTCGQERDFIEHFLGTLEEERRALEIYKNALAYYTDKGSGDRKIIIKSSIMKKLFSSLDNITNTDSTVILYGESGVGKDVVANYIHSKSNRAQQPFIPVNCAAIPQELMESEFFGYEKGAFTGANINGKPGIFEIAHNGTLFLDEVAELPLNLQTKLLRVLETRETTRLGGVKPTRFSTRLIAATNRDLPKMVKEGAFREDLYYRLNVIPLTIPPLRERIDDIEPLANLFLEEFNKKYSLRRRFARDIIDLFRNYAWRGNIRELKNIVERLVITSSENLINIDHLKTMNMFFETSSMESNSSQEKKNGAEEAEYSAAATLRSQKDHGSERSPVQPGATALHQTGSSFTLQETYDQMLQSRVLEEMIRQKGNKTKVALELGISRGKLYRILEQSKNR